MATTKDGLHDVSCGSFARQAARCKLSDRKKNGIRARATRAFALALRELRERYDLTQEELEEITGVQRTFISALERGRNNATVATMYKLLPGFPKTTLVQFAALIDKYFKQLEPPQESP